MSESEPRPAEPGERPKSAYEPPRLVRVGSLRDLRKKSSPAPDQQKPGAPHPQRP